MRRKRILLIAALICLSMIPIILALSGSSNPETQGEVTNGPVDGPGLVVPESPIGTLGIMSGLMIAFVVFALIKRR